MSRPPLVTCARKQHPTAIRDRLPPPAYTVRPGMNTAGLTGSTPAVNGGIAARYGKSHPSPRAFAGASAITCLAGRRQQSRPDHVMTISRRRENGA